MIAVWKYPLHLQDEVQELMVPAGADLIHVGEQNGSPRLWFLVDTKKPKMKRTFRVYGTGHEINGQLESMSHVGTTVARFGGWVGHVFEIVGAPQARSVQ